MRKRLAVLLFVLLTVSATSVWAYPTKVLVENDAIFYTVLIFVKYPNKDGYVSKFFLKSNTSGIVENADGIEKVKIEFRIDFFALYDYQAIVTLTDATNTVYMNLFGAYTNDGPFVWYGPDIVD